MTPSSGVYCEGPWDTGNQRIRLNGRDSKRQTQFGTRQRLQEPCGSQGVVPLHSYQPVTVNPIGSILPYTDLANFPYFCFFPF